MLTRFTCLAAMILTLSAVVPAVAEDKSEEGFVPMFNGKDLTGWDAKPGWWYVEDGAITSQSTPEKPCTKCNYIIWKGGEPGNFELRCKFRLVGGNSGIQFRSQRRPEWDTYGYQADMDAQNQYTGCLYEHARGCITQCGQQVVIDPSGKKQITALGDGKELLKQVKNGEWNDYVIVARGNEITLAINGVVMSRVTDSDAKHAAAKGIIGLQVHPGPPMKVQFKDLRIKNF